MRGRQKSLAHFESHQPCSDLSDLTDAERDVFEAIEQGEYGPREYADETSRSPGTIGNLLARARVKVDGGDAS
ncbi:sigma-70 family RNA polymerase sigma factor [Halomicrobium mukohataei]|uniref:RNA polymerase, sigma-24 subunit, ECF subfamily n=1 Tax=Halomicrobium mukohataei (strain ATCC 700874 / DSM 12286 / JCM 9738 / NCIMB 13541) TaxID=485914 RepID=C7NYE1_HALMD|nr:sigma-70 family RNA polymerase sigma factor [Halomicrobium mukohataei]ACV46602.1 RNA polymerase, sigma-24 subunit, ECF subfamily [Halomicrobium mukohataei DSM 12286]